MRALGVELGVMPRRAHVNGIEMSYLDTGGSLPTVLLVHGYTLDHSMWSPQVDVLRDRWRVIAPDLRGFGASESGPPGSLTMEQHADDLAALLEQLGVGGPVPYVGLSMGGFTGLAFWRRHRERVRGLLLADTNARDDTAARREARLAMAREVETRGSTATVVDWMWPRLCAPDLSLDSPVPQALKRMLDANSIAGVVGGQLGMAARSSSLDLLPSINVPVLVVVGERDVLTPPDDARQAAELLPSGRLLVIPDVGHMSNMEAPDIFNAAMQEWLAAL